MVVVTNVNYLLNSDDYAIDGGGGGESSAKDYVVVEFLGTILRCGTPNFTTVCIEKFPITSTN